MTDGDRIDHETRLRAAVLAGDESAWRAWYDAHSADMARYVRWRCGGAADVAADALQDAWLTAVRRIKAFDPARGSFFQWLGGVAANCVRAALRKRAAGRLRPLTGDEPAPSANERSLRTAVALAQLNPRFERALREKYLDGKCVQAMADDWGDTAKAVESVLARARDAFRAAYERAELSDG